MHNFVETRLTVGFSRCRRRGPAPGRVRDPCRAGHLSSPSAHLSPISTGTSHDNVVEIRYFKYLKLS